MADPFVYGGSAFPYNDVPFHTPPYGDVDDAVLVDPSMTIYIDPRLQSSSPSPYPNNCWPAPVVPASSLKSAPESAVFFGAPIHTHAHASLRPTVGVTPVHRPAYARYASPISSVEPSSASSGSAFSPPAETESFFDSHPRTPNDTALLSPFPTPLPLEPYHAVQFASMGPDYVDPNDLNPAQPAEFCDTDNGIIDFFGPQMSFTFDSHVGQPGQGVMVPGLVEPAHPGLTPEELSQYPLPSREEDSDEEALLKRKADDDADEDYRPSKRSRPNNTRAPPRRSTTTAPSRPRRSRGAAPTANSTAPSHRALPPASSSTTPASRNLTCPSCSQPGFATQPDLDAHVKRDHRPFNCVFDFAGCEATFATKNEWKRHAATQHLLLHYWRCTEGSCANPAADASSPSSSCSSSDASDSPAGPNGAIFNRKDLFTQHLQRMHAPQQVKDHLASSKKSKSTPTSTASPSAATAALLTSWTNRLRNLQQTSMHARCALPTLMRCPVPSCAEPPFRGHDAWNQRMEHVAKHMEQPAPKPGKHSSSSSAGKAGASSKKAVIFGGANDPTLVQWASREDVAIIEPAPGFTGPTGGEGEWVLKTPLKRGPGGCVVVTAPVQGTQQGQRGRKRGWGERGEVGGGIVVGSAEGEEEEEEEEDAEGEDD